MDPYRHSAAPDNPVVIGALYSNEARSVATSILGRRSLWISPSSDFVGSTTHERARALLFELGHPAFADLCTRLSAVGSTAPLVLVLPPGSFPARDLLTLSRIASFSLAYDHRELSTVLQRTVTDGCVASDVSRVSESLRRRLPTEAAAIALGLYAVGTRNVTVSKAAARLGFGGAMRNRLRALGLARATTILGWSCAVGIVWRMTHERRSLADIAHAAGFETTRQCSDRVLYHTGRTPTALCDRYGFDRLVDEFVDVVRLRVPSAT